MVVMNVVIVTTKMKTKLKKGVKMEIFKAIFGSKLYGTATLESDTDYKK